MIQIRYLSVLVDHQVDIDDLSEVCKIFGPTLVFPLPPYRSHPLPKISKAFLQVRATNSCGIRGHPKKKKQAAPLGQPPPPLTCCEYKRTHTYRPGPSERSTHSLRQQQQKSREWQLPAQGLRRTHSHGAHAVQCSTGQDTTRHLQHPTMRNRKYLSRLNLLPKTKGVRSTLITSVHKTTPEVLHLISCKKISPTNLSVPFFSLKHVSCTIHPT